MKKNFVNRLLFVASFMSVLIAFSGSVHADDSNAPIQEKEWTFLLFLNGHNNLDSYGALNINGMEQVGSNENLNMVVQWASLKYKKTRRLLVQKDNDLTKVTSPVVQEMPQVDMGDYRQLVEFVRWGVQNYPAKKYMIAVWNHGNGWQRFALDGSFQAQDISYDDVSGRRITTEELGVAMAEAAQIIGHKVDIYGSDACLMAMAEVAGEMKNSVSHFVGSEEVEPGEGWPYSTWMQRWEANPTASAAEVSTYLTEEYVKAYDGGIYGKQDVTFSAMDLSKLDGLYAAVSALNASLVNLGPADLTLARTAARATQNYYTADYRDLGDFMDQLTAQKVMVSDVLVTDVKTAISDLVVSVESTDGYKKSHGVSVWLPTASYGFTSYKDRYAKLDFSKSTGWVDFLALLTKK